MKKLLATALLSLAALGHASVSELDFEERAPSEDLHLWFSPMVGSVGPGPAVGVGVNGSNRHIMGSVRFIFADEFCLFCQDSEQMQQSLFLLGFKNEGPVGYIALMTGLSKESGTKKGALIDDDDGGMFFSSSPRYEMSSYSGFGVPIVIDLGLTTPNFGIAATFVLNASENNPGAGLFINLPMGSIRN